jgi:BolA protein
LTHPCGADLAAAKETTITVQQLIEDRLTAALAPQRLIVVDESAAHAGHAGHREGGESHFRVRIVAERFRTMSRVDRHRAVNAALAEAFAAGVHALAIEAAAPDEPTRW